MAFWELGQGAEVTIRPGYGMEPSDIERTEVILSVDGFSAMTNQGTILCCMDADGVVATGRILNWKDYEVSPLALQRLNDVGMDINVETGEVS